MIESNDVKLHFLDYWRVIKVRWGLILLVFLLVMISAGVATYFMEREYLAKVSMEVKPDTSKAVPIFGEMAQRSYDPQFVSTQFQILRKSDILYPVIDQLNLEKVYSEKGGARLNKQQVFLMLNADLVTQEIRNTGLIEIGVYNPDPQMAANIANTIASVYRNSRLQRLQEGIDRSLEQFRDEVEKQRKVVIKAAQEVAAIRERDGIVDPDPDNSGANISGTDRSTVATEQAVNEQRTKVAELHTQMARIEALRPEELMEALRTLNIEDQTVLKNLPLLQDAAAEEARLLGSGLGENHPRIRALRAMSDVYRKNLSGALESIRRAQATKLTVAQDTLAALEDKMEEARKLQISEKNKSGNYLNTKTEYLQQKKILEAAEMRLSSVRMERGIDIDPAYIWQRAEPPLYPAKPPVRLYLALSALVGIVTGIGLAFFIEYLDTSVKTLDDVERYLKLPVLAVIPKGVPTLMKQKSDSMYAEAYRILRANIEFNKPDPNAKVFTLLSAGPGEGKSTTLNNLAFTCAKGGYNVLVVDADLRRPSQHRIFEVDNSSGFADYLTGKATIDEITRTTQIDNLSFIPSGQLPGNDAGLLNAQRQRLSAFLEKVKQQYDMVFFDSPPVLGVSDGAVLASEADVSVMVVQHRRFPRAMLQRVKQAVIQSGGVLIGVVLNNVDARHDEGYGYYNAYNDYYPAGKEQRRAPSTGAPGRKPTTPAAARPAATDHGDY